MNKEKLFINIKQVLEEGSKYSGISVSDNAIKKALNGNLDMCECLLSIINERIKWWLKCDINKALYAKEIYDLFENYYMTVENDRN
jgi:hypothetical protein